MLVRLAQASKKGGESRSAWRERIRALALLDQIRQPRQRHALLRMVVFACLQQGLTRTARHAAEALVEAARRGIESRLPERWAPLAQSHPERPVHR